MIRAAMRRLLLRFLLLAVFFNTVIGVPLHAAQHVHEQHTPAQVCAHEHAGAPDAQEACHAEDLAGIHAACTWCASHAQLGMAALPAKLDAPPALTSPARWHAVGRQGSLPAAPRTHPPARAPPSMH
jgi:hypothetical protein